MRQSGMERQRATNPDAALRLLRQALDDPAIGFRQGQWEAIDALVNRRARLFLVQRTGWGKSAVYFLAARLLRNRGFGPALIVSPLLALMRNQIEAAERLDVQALTINSTNTSDWPDISRRVQEDEADVLLVSPERLANDEFVESLLLPMAARIGLLVIDEAHCISDWGHDFRPDYRRLVNVLQRMPDTMPLLGTTATANDRVIADVQAQLGQLQVQRGPLMRRSLVLQTLRLPSQAARLAWLAAYVASLPGTGIIYTLTKRDALQVAAWLEAQGIKSAAYFSDIVHTDFPDTNSYRVYLEDQLQRNAVKALVATTALGMGFDKPDLGFVVHYQAPSSIVAYYQQVGRAGRGLARAVGLMMAGAEDERIHEYFRRAAFPREEWVRQILDALETRDGLSVPALEAIVNLQQSQIKQALKYLSVENPAPVVKIGQQWRRTPVPYRMNHAAIRRLSHARAAEWQEVQRYIGTAECLMKFLAESLNDPRPEACGKCASCQGQAVMASSVPQGAVAAAARFLRRSEMPLRCNRQVAKDAFPAYGLRGRLAAELRAEEGRILSRWGDAGWGQLVEQGKKAGRFSDELVDAVAEMLRERWQPSPRPEWVTCVPSRAGRNAVPDYARRLAAVLQLPFQPVVAKVKDNQPQKEQQNRFHQCRNLDGAFAVQENVREEPALLVDDIVDSGWTLTVIAALLRRAGSGAVWPLALATTKMGA